MSEIPVRLVEHYRVRIPCKDGTHPEGDWDYRWRVAGGEDIAGLQPGDAYWSMPHESPCTTWGNCDGRHLLVILPDMSHWNVDGRASNCDMKDDRVHRCWVRHGRPEDGSLHVDKAGLTCHAGAGSILAHNGWHGFLHNGALRAC